MRSRAGTSVLVALLALGVAVVATWPLAAHLGTHTMGEKFLRSYYLYDHIATHGPSEWWTAHYTRIYFPDGGTGVTNGIPLYVLGGALRRLTTPVFAINAAILLHLWAGAWAGWRLSRRYWESAHLPEAVHVAAGVGMALNSQVVAAFANGQMENLGLMYVALAAEGVLVWLREGRSGALLGGTLACACAFAMSPYLVMGLFLCGPVLLRGAPPRRILVAAAALGLMSAPFAVHFSATVAGVADRLFCPAELPTAPDADRLVPLVDVGTWLVSRHPDGPVQHSLDLGYLVHPPRVPADPEQSHFLVGGYLGVTLLAFLVLALVRRRDGVSPLLLAAAIPRLLGMGPFLHVNGWVPMVGGAPIPLPLAPLRALPGLGGLFRTIQYPIRLLMGASLPLWLVAATGMAMDRMRGRVLVVGAILGSSVEQRLLYPTSALWLLPVRVDGAHAALALEPDRLALLDLPPVGFGGEPGSPTSGAPFPVSLAARMVRDAITHRHPVPYRVGCFDDLCHPTVRASGVVDVVQHALAGHGPVRKDLVEAFRGAMRTLQGEGFGWVAVHPGTRWSTAVQDGVLIDLTNRTPTPVHIDPDGSRLYRIPPE